MIELIDVTLNDILERSAALYPQRPAINSPDGSLSYEQMEEKTDRLARYLYSIGIRCGDAVAMITETNMDAMLMLYALFRSGAVAAPLNPVASEEEIKHYLHTIAPKLILCYRGSVAESISHDVKICYMDDHFSEWSMEECEQDTRTMGSVSSGDPALLIFTSGSTSSPKAVTLTQYCLLNSARTLGRVMGIKPEDRVCSALPVFHSFCISVNMLIPTIFGACTCISRDHHTINVLRAVQDYECTVLNGVPALFHAIIKRNDLESFRLKTLRTGFIGGAYCPPELFFEIEDKLDMTLLPTLGETECTGGYTVGAPSLPQSIRAASVGRPLDHMKVQIQTPDGKEAETGKNGEICVTGYLLMPGYWYRGDLLPGNVSEDGYIHTGDIGRMDEDENVFVSGRLSNIIIRAGENISPAEIEKAIMSAGMTVDCSVIGVPDSHNGEEICACLLENEEKNLNIQRLRGILAQSLSPYKVPKYFILLQELPYSRIGKVQKKKLKETAMNMIKEGKYE